MTTKLLAIQDGTSLSPANLRNCKFESCRDVDKLEQEQGKLVYRPNDGEKQEKTLMSDEQIAKIAEEIGDVAPATKPKAKKNKNKKKK